MVTDEYEAIASTIWATFVRGARAIKADIDALQSTEAPADWTPPTNQVRGTTWNR